KSVLPFSMLAASPTFCPAPISKSVPVSDLRVLCVSVFSSPNLSPFNFKPSTLNFFSLTPSPATLTSHLQLIENKTTLSLLFATLTRRVKVNPFVCHSYKKHPGVGSPSNERLSSFPANFTDHGSRNTNPSSRPLLAT